MTMPQRVAITDANIFIDLLILNLLEEFFQLPLNICTTIEVILELDPPQQDILRSYENIESLYIEHEATVSTSLQFNSGFSPVDRTLLSWAVLHNCLLLSGERMMRTWCKERSIEYHGILWVFDKLLEHNIIDKPEASQLLKQLIAKNQRLPIQDCLARIKEWSS